MKRFLQGIFVIVFILLVLEVVGVIDLVDNGVVVEPPYNMATRIPLFGTSTPERQQQDSESSSTPPTITPAPRTQQSSGAPVTTQQNEDRQATKPER